MIELEDLLQATGGHTHGPIGATRFGGFCHDARTAAPDQIFVAVRTGWADGHDHILDACRGGVQGVLCERPPDAEPCAVTCIVVPDTQTALADWAHLALKRRAIEVIGVSGSAGKTTAKEAIAAVLARVAPVFKSPGNSGGRLGLSIGLGQLQPEQRLAVLEMACDTPGEMADLLHIANPRHAVVLNVSAAHLEAMGSLENVAREQGRLVEALPAAGWAVLNCDDPLVAAMATRTPAQVLRIGLAPEADLCACDVDAGADGLSFTLIARGDGPAARFAPSGASATVRSRLLGRHNVYPLLAAAAMGLVYGLSLAEAAESLQGFVPLPGRLRPLPGRAGALIIDDTWSATPAAMEAALAVLAGLPHARKIAVLGDMAQLGPASAAAHRRAGAQAAEVVDTLVTCGERMRLGAQEAALHGLARERIRVAYTPGDALRAIEGQLGPDVAVLVKGAAETRLEQVVAGLLAEGVHPGEVLVRQGPGWRAAHRKLPSRPTWLEIDLEAIANNVRLLRQMIAERVALMAVVKADGYGHNAVRTARTALNNGASWLGVACLSEALALRNASIDVPVLVLGYTPPWQAREMLAHDIDATVYSLEAARALSRAAGELGTQAHVHIKVDTGMGRLGLLPEDALPFVAAIAALPGIVVRGLFTHFAMADCADRTHCSGQWRRFREVVSALEQRGLRPPIVHAANSAATIAMPEAHCDLVRVGIALYGLNPSDDVPCPAGFRPAMAFKTQVAQVKAVPAGSGVSYGCTYRTARESRLAVIPVGYADGFRRTPHNWGYVLVRGQRAPIVGRVCMDQTILDVTDIAGVRQGDEVVLIGRQGGERITADEVAARLGTINYEVVSEILARVPREFS